MQVYNEKEQVDQKEIQNAQFGEKRNIKGLNVIAKVCARREARRTEELRRGLLCTVMKGRCPQGKTPTQLSF